MNTNSSSFAVRIVCVDSYMSTPISGLDITFSDFRGASVYQVPVIRLFGSIPTGEKICVHVHNVFPYIYLPFDDTEEVNQLMQRIALNIDKAVNISLNQATSNLQHVYKITLVSGTPMYGFHQNQHQYLKIHFYNPLIVRRVCNLLQNEQTLGKLYQPHESHLSFTLQFMIDYNLHGMNDAVFEQMKFRQNSTFFTPVNADLFLPASIVKTTICQIEADVLAESITNQEEVRSGNLAVNPGIAALWEDERQRLRNNNENSLLNPCLSLTASNDVKPTKSHEAFKQALNDRIAISEMDKLSTEKVNNSVYPAETPSDSTLPNASSNESFLPCSWDSSLNESLDLNATQNDNMSITLDEEALKFMRVLDDLKEGAHMAEEDSILSQVLEAYEDDDFNLSMPLESVTTPQKIEEKMDVSADSDDELNTTLVPQLDGTVDDEDQNNNLVIYSQRNNYKKLPDMPLLDTFEGLKRTSDSQSTVNKPINILPVDGAIDESDEETGKIRKQSIGKRKRSPVYKPLPISVESNSSTAFLSSSQSTLNGQSMRKSKNSTLRRVKSSETHNNIKVKRQLNFNDDLIPNNINCSIIQENIECKLKTKWQIAKPNLIVGNNSVIDLNFNNKCDSFVQNVNTVAEQYDIENQFKAVEGSSKSVSIILSQNSQSTSTFQNIPTVSSHRNQPFIYKPILKAPTKQEIETEVKILKHFQEPFYSNVEDITGSVEIGYNILKILSKSTGHLPQFESHSNALNNYRKLKLKEYSMSDIKLTKTTLTNLKQSFCGNRECVLTPLFKPPTVREVNDWLKQKSVIKQMEIVEKKPEKVRIFMPSSPGCNEDNDEDNSMDLTLSLSPSKSSQESDGQPTSPVILDKAKTSKIAQYKSKCTGSLRKSLLISQESLVNSCQISGMANKSFKPQQNMQEVRALVEHQNLTLLVMELHIRTRGDFKPNPEYDSIRAIFYSIHNDVNENHPKGRKAKGIIAVNSLPISPNKFKPHNILDGFDCDVIYTNSEENLINEFLKLVKEWDPDIMAGYEIELLSWGYLVERSNILGVNLVPLLSRTSDSIRHRDEDSIEIKFTGRILLDVWRLMRHEIALQSYTFESIVYNVLHKRVPLYSYKDLSFWWDHRSMLYRHRTAHYYLLRVIYILDLFEELDLIGRTSELARLFGIQFYEVLSRGSQFRVESMMLRLAKPLNFIPVSPSVQQRAHMRAPEFLPLILEPESKLYVDPVIVLDFQSLYPSMIIAYNYCFTTCLGRVEHLGKRTPFEFGATQLKVSRTMLKKLMKKDLINFSPCGVAFVKSRVRDGILPRMLREILDTRLMVKNSMKQNANDPILKKVLHNRQLGLKLIANVTYGYTAANFSGRMPSVEVGDSVVSKGRETLQRAITMVDNTPEWNARVVYGDTDSLFVLVPGRTRKEAFDIGKKIANAITADNPKPVKLKLEKIYQPSILQTKKRYVGYMYESPEQDEPVFDAKGIETVRRDGCPAVSKMLEKCLKILFDTKDVSLIKKYVQRQFHKILAGRVNIQDLTFAKEYRGASGYRPGACVPALELTRKWTAVDKRNEPRSGERVPYVIVNGPPGLPLIRMVHSPRDLLNDPSLRPNALYYITRVIIPPINRCFNLIGADLNKWFNEMPRRVVQYLPTSSPTVKRNTISQYFMTTACASCGTQTQSGLCISCFNKPQLTSLCLMEKIRTWEQNFQNCLLICKSCTGAEETNCISLDCPVLYRKNQTSRDFQQTSYVRQLMVTNELAF